MRFGPEGSRPEARPEVMITAIVLAAGESKRIGIPKALLKIGRKSFIRHIVDVLKASNLQKIVVVLGSSAEAIRQELEGTDVTVVINNDYRRGQLSSILEGIAIAETFSPAGILIHPVDHPLVGPRVIEVLLRTFSELNPPIVVPTFEGKRGHPVIFSATLFNELRKAPPEAGARAVVWAHVRDLVEIETEEGGVILNIDTREDYEHLQEHLRDVV